MKIKKVEAYGLYLPLRQPFIVAYERYDQIPTILTKIETEDGHIGWGEAVPDQHVTGETWESVFQVLKHELAPLIIGEDPFNIGLIHKKMDEKIYGSPAAKAAIDIALYDLMGKICEQPLYRLIGGRSHESIEVPHVISILPPEKMASEAQQIVEAGYAHIKIKVGTDPVLDVDRIRSVRDAIPDRIKLRVDANQGWDFKGTLYVLENTKDCKVEWYEQPVKATDFVSLAEIRKATAAKIMVDEGVHNIEDLLRLIELRGADLVNIKLMKTGGIYPALALANLAEATRMPCQLGSMCESAIGTMAGAHLSLSQSIIQSSELAGPLTFMEDVAESHVQDGTFKVNDSPGLGIEVDQSFVKERTKLHFLID